MSDGRKSDGTLGRLLRNVRSAFIGSAAIDRVPAKNVSSTDATATTGAAGTTAKAAVASATTDPAPRASELINEGLRQRQRFGTETARPFFEKAAQLEP